MRLLNHTLLYLSVALFLIISTWAGIYYYQMLDEVRDSIDDGLDNYKTLIIQKAGRDSTVLLKHDFDESNYAVREIPQWQAAGIKDVYKDTLMYMLNEAENEPVRILSTAFALRGHYYQLKVVSSMVEEDDLVEDLLYSLLWLYLVMIASIIIVNNLVLKRVWRPFYQLLDQLKNYKLGQDQGNTRLPQTKVKEFKALNETVSELLKRNLEIYNSQKQFIENAAHELQTPLAICINKLELLSEQQHFSEDDLRAVSQVIQNLERLTRLNKSLLLLSKIENRQFENSEAVNISGLLKKLCDDFADMAAHKDIIICLKSDAELQYTMNRDLALVLFTNLIKNAIVHNKSGGYVRIVIAGNTVDISNNGKDEALDASKIFGRFYRQSSDSKHSTGLGLAIVKAIADLYGIRISYSFDKEHHIRLQF